VQKIINIEYYMNHSIPFSLQEKEHSFHKKDNHSQKGQLIYKLRAIHSEGTFSEIKEIQEFKQSKRRGRQKVEIDLILEAIVFNLRKIRKQLNATLI